MINNTKKNIKARVGMVNYINTAPIYESWKKSVFDKQIVIVEEPPSVLNRMLAAGEIDLGFVSSYEYCARPEDYLILRDLSISASGPVGSVFLFSDVELEQLDKKLVLLSNQSETSVHLVKILLEEFYNIKPQYIHGEVEGEMSRSCKAVLAIGDDALRLLSSGRYTKQFDLGEIWHGLTRLPFVFSVCAVRREFCENNGLLVERIKNIFVQCRKEGREELEEICRIVAPRIPMDTEKCYKYLTALQYDLDESKCLALEKFYSFLIERGEASKNALPLQFI